MRVEGVRHTKASGSSIGYKKGRDKPKANTTKTETTIDDQNDSKMCKTKLVLSEAWAELSPPRRKERSRGGGVQVRRGKNPRQGESLDNTKTKQTVQLRTSKIHKTRRQAGGLITSYTFHDLMQKPCWNSYDSIHAFQKDVRDEYFCPKLRYSEIQWLIISTTFLKWHFWSIPNF